MLIIFGVLVQLRICLGIQIISGVFLAMHYVPHVDYAFLALNILCEM